MANSTLPFEVTRRRLVGAMAGAPLVAGNASADSSSGDVARAISESRSHLLDARVPDGDYWASNISMGQGGNWDARLTLYYALLLEHLDAKEQSKQAAIEWALGQRQQNGGWNDANANFAGLLLFDLLDGDQYDEVVSDIEAENQKKGFALVDEQQGFGEQLDKGILRVKLLYLLLDDEYERDELVQKGATTRLMGMMRMTAAFEGDSIAPTEEFVHEPFINLMLATGLLLAVTDDQTEKTEAMADLTSELLLGRRALNGTWGMSIEQLFAMFALSGVGYGAEDPEISRALDYLEETWQHSSGRLMPFRLPVFDTGWAMQALHESGVSAQNDVMTDAAQWLYDARKSNPMFARKNEPLDYPRPRPPFREHWNAGWGYRPYTESDWDDTAVAIYGWSPYDEDAIGAEIEFLVSAQRPNGAWGTWHASEMQALTADDRKRIVEKFGREFWENVSWLFSDPGVVDVTGHALLALGEHGYTVENSDAARKAVSWLFEQQGESIERAAQEAEDGLWVTPRGRGYMYGTSRAILGMKAVGVDMDRPEIEAATTSLVERQRADGSWGKSGIRPVQTARAVRALLAAGVPSDDPAVKRGVRYLLETQREDGSWKSGRFMVTITGRPYTLSVLAQAEALEALVAYGDAQGISYEPDDETSLLGLSEDDLPEALGLTTLFALIAGLLSVRRRE